jgi:hypothetical protein
MKPRYGTVGTTTAKTRSSLRDDAGRCMRFSFKMDLCLDPCLSVDSVVSAALAARRS